MTHNEIESEKQRIYISELEKSGEPYTTLPCSTLCTRNAGSALLATRLPREIGPLAVNRDRQTNETERRVAGNDATYEE